jgi:hypothetical protein
MVLRNSTLVLNSKDRDVASDDTNNFSITLARPVFNVVKAEFRYFFLENGIWNIDSTANEVQVTLTLISTGVATNTTIAIPQGYYSQASLCNAIQDEFNLFLPGAITEVSIVSSGNLLLRSTLYTISVFFDINDTNQNLTAEILGFLPGVTYNSVTLLGTQVLQSPLEVSISAYPYIYLQSSKLQNQLLTSSSLSAFAIVPMTSSLQGVGNADVALGTTYDAGSYPLDASYFNQPVTLDRVDIRLVDDRGELLDTRSNNVTIVLRLAHTV